ncbi:MAG: hypothetical protein GKR77_04855 [Legionellales bacterium]|nr:hypothetical protein [Legionellales bacterium]
MDFLEPNNDYTAEQINQLLAARIRLADDLIILPNRLNLDDLTTQLNDYSKQAILLFQAEPAVIEADENKQDITTDQPQWHLVCGRQAQGQAQPIDTQQAIGSQLTNELTQYCQKLQQDNQTRFAVSDNQDNLDIKEETNWFNSTIELLLHKNRIFQLAHHLLGLPVSTSVLTDYYLSSSSITETHFSTIKKTFVQCSQHQLTLAASTLNENDSPSSGSLSEIRGEYRFIRLVYKFPDKQEMQDATIYLQCNSKAKKNGQVYYRFLNCSEKIIEGQLPIESLTSDMQTALEGSIIRRNVIKNYCCGKFDTREIVRLTQYKKQRHPNTYQVVLPDLIQKIAKGMRTWIKQAKPDNNQALQILWPVYIPSTVTHRSTTAPPKKEANFKTIMGEWYLVEWHIVLPDLEDGQVFFHSGYLSQDVPQVLQIVVDGLHDAFRREAHTLDDNNNNDYFYQCLTKNPSLSSDNASNPNAASSSHFKRELEPSQPDAGLSRCLSTRQQSVSSLNHKIFHHPGHLPLLRDGDTHSSGVAITTLALLRLDGGWANQHPLPYSRGAWLLRLRHSQFWHAVTPPLHHEAMIPPNQPFTLASTPAWQQETETDLQATIITDPAIWTELFPADISTTPLSPLAEQAERDSRGFYALVTDGDPIYLFAHHADFNLKRLVFTAAALGDVEMLEATVDWSSVLTPWYEKLAAIKDPLRAIDTQLNKLQILEDGIKRFSERAKITHLLHTGSIPSVIIEWFIYAFKISLKFCDQTAPIWNEMQKFVGGDYDEALQANDQTTMIELINHLIRYLIILYKFQYAP